MKGWTRVAVAAALIGGAGCDDLTMPDEPAYEQPEPDLGLDPDSAVVGALLASHCDRGAPLRGRAEHALVDIQFGRRSENEALAGPRPEHLRAVTARGGVVVHRFQIPAVRAWIRLGEVPDLVARDGAVLVRAVPNPRRLDVEVAVGYVPPLQDGDLEGFRRLGGRVTHRWDSFSGLAGVLPDRSLPALLASGRTRYVEANGVVCLA